MATGPSTLVNPYLVALEPNVSFTSILTVGDKVGFKSDGTTPWRMVGIPDGLGAFDNGDGTITVLMNHELGATQGAVRDHGAKGAFVSQLVIDKATLKTLSAADAIKQVNLWNDATQAYEPAAYAIGRLCSSDLAPVSSFYDAATGLGTTDRIYLTGEENGAEGKGFATVITGVDKGKAFELANLGLFSYENIAANPFAQKKTITVGTDDSTGGQLYVHVGEKQATGSTIEKAGLTGGKLYGLKVDGVTAESNGTIAAGLFSLQEMGNAGDASKLTGAQLEAESVAEGVTSFLRPEDAAWDPTQPNTLYFTTTNGFGNPSRLYKASFTDITRPELGGKIEAVLDGTEGQQMFDNMTVTAEGKVILQEDVGNNAHLGRVFEYDPATDTLSVIAQHDPALFLSGAPGFKTQDEESSGVIDVTDMLGDSDTKAYLLDVQSHNALADPELVQDGQLLAMYVDKPVTKGTNGDDYLFGSQADETFTGLNGKDLIRAGSGNDRINAGSGNDTVDAGAGDDRVDAGSGIDVVDGGAGHDHIEAGHGHDVLNGGAGNDRIEGEAGQDKITGGLGQDWLKGGSGSDRFIFTALADSMVGAEDRIVDFSRGQKDRIDLSSIDANGLLDGDQGFTVATAFHNVAGELVISRAAKSDPYLVQGDVNGDGIADFSLFVAGTSTLFASDFLL